jgi:hypothetical protein
VIPNNPKKKKNLLADNSALSEPSICLQRAQQQDTLALKTIFDVSIHCQYSLARRLPSMMTFACVLMVALAT